MINRFPTARFFIRAGCSAWFILGSVAVLPFTINVLWNIVQKLNVWQLPLYGLTCIILGSIGLLCFVLSLAIISCRKLGSGQLEARSPNDMSVTNTIHPRIRERLRGYRFWSATLMGTFVTLGMLSVVCSLAAATYTDELKERDLLKLTILVAACCSALITAFNLQGKSADIWHAFRHLEQAILEHEYNASIDAESLLRAYKESEDMVGFFEFKEPKLNK